MWRTIIAIGASLVLSMAFLAACEVDDNDDVNDVADDPVGVDDDPAVTDEEDDVAVTDDPDDAVADDPADDAVIDDEDDAVIDDTDDAVTDDTDDAVTDDDEMAADETYDVTLSEHEIDMETTIDAGTVAFEVSNDGEVLHGIAIQEAAANGDNEEAVNDDEDDAALDDEDDAVVDDDDAATNDDDEENGEAEAGAMLAAVTVDAGDAEELEVELEPGEYIVFCPIAEHRDEEGMEEVLTVE